MLNPKLKTGTFSIGGACKHSWPVLAGSVRNDNFPDYAQDLQKALSYKYQLVKTDEKEFQDEWIYEEEERLILRAA